MPEKGRCICVIARSPAAEQLRMAAGLISVHNNIVVVIADHILVPDETTREHLEALRMLGVRLLTNMEGSPFDFMDDAGISGIIAGCDIVLS